LSEFADSATVTLEMKLFRTISMFLVLVLATSPALAAICAAACASQSVASSSHVSEMSGMQHCHEDSMPSNQDNPSDTHKTCVMGAGCHFTQVVFPFDGLSKYIVADSSSAAFPKFVPSEKSIDLSPPLKPPA
jgi:hypothetical protein